MELIYQNDAYQRVLDTEVKAIEVLNVSAGPGRPEVPRKAVQFASTIIYPGGGGQEPDTGYFSVLKDKKAGEKSGLAGETSATRLSAIEKSQVPILGIFKDGADIWYLTENLAPLPGTPVRLTIDWQKRYDLMRTHTAIHILIGVIWRDYRKLVTGSNLDFLKARLDFEFEELGPQLLEEIERRANLEVTAARPVEVSFAETGASVDGLIRTKTNLVPDGIRRLRFVDLVGLDRQADGGTHVRSTSEVGHIHITGFENKGRINKRIKLVLDPAAAPD